MTSSDFHLVMSLPTMSLEVGGTGGGGWDRWRWVGPPEGMAVSGFDLERL